MSTPLPETLLERHSSRPRNRNIANAFFKAGFVDAWGRGYKKIREGFESAGLPMPVIESADGGVRVTFQRNNANGSQTNVASNVTSDVTSLSPVQLTDRQKKICELIKGNPQMSASEMSPVLSVAIRTVRRDLVLLQKMGVLIREGNTSAGRWVIVQKEN